MSNLRFFIISENEIETCREIRIKWGAAMGAAVLFLDMRVGLAKLLINFTRPKIYDV